ncbi:MAG: hypothetical protein WA231_06075 [Methylocella sp.]
MKVIGQRATSNVPFTREVLAPSDRFGHQVWPLRGDPVIARPGNTVVATIPVGTNPQGVAIGP